MVTKTLLRPRTKEEKGGTKLEASIEARSQAGEFKPPSKITQDIVRIERPKFRRMIIPIVGMAPYVQNRFSQKAIGMMEATQRAGSQAKAKRQREPKDFEALYEGAKHYSREGWVGMPASAFRNAMISACRVAGFAMTRAKLSIFIVPDGFDREDGTSLIKIEGEPQISKMWARNDSGVPDIRWRPMWIDWKAKVCVRWDEDQFSVTDVVNLMVRVGAQVGVGEGRPDSPNSNGLDWGLFEIVE